MDQSKLEQLLVARNVAVPIYPRETVASTNDLLKGMDLRPFGAAFAVAEHQTAGRGRMGRSFFSPEGGLYLSFAFHPRRKARLPVTIAAAVAVCDAVETLCGVRPEIKWPNDILLGGRKLCGILAEAFGTGKQGAVIIGAGLNLNTPEFPPELAGIATSLKLHFGRDFDWETAAAELIAAFLALPADAALKRSRKNNRQAAETLERYRQDCATLGQAVAFSVNNTPMTGTAESIGEDGALNIRLGDGSLFSLTFGEISLLPALQTQENPV